MALTPPQEVPPLSVDYTKQEVAAALRMCIRTLENKMRDGSIGYYRSSRRPRFSEQHIEEYRRKCEQKAYRKP